MIRRALAVATALPIALVVGLATGTPLPAAGAVVRAHAATPARDCSATFFDNDQRLGPAHIPTAGPVGRELKGYHRTGGLAPAQFLKTYWDPSASGGTGGWIYPPANGFVIGSDGKPIEYNQLIKPGNDIDRFGSEFGTFLSPAGLPYASRAIPPQNLDSTPAPSCHYYDYEVLKAFTVKAGPIAPWFAQPGYGWQYLLLPRLIHGAPKDLNVMWLLQHGYLKRIHG